MANNPETIYEVVVRLEGSGLPLITHIEEPEYERFVSALGNGNGKTGDFHGFRAADGVEAFVNLGSVVALNVPNYTGLSDGGQEQGAFAFAEPDTESATVLLRVWSTMGAQPDLFPEVPRTEWREIQRVLQDHSEPFLAFTDEVGDRIILPRRRIAAVEICDTSKQGEARNFREFYEAPKPSPVEVAID